MESGVITKLVHLSQQTSQPTSRLVADHNDKGYGLLNGEDGREVYFRHDAVESRYGFDDLRLGQQVNFTLEAATYLRATWVKPFGVAPAKVEEPSMRRDDVRRSKPTGAQKADMEFRTR